MRRTLVRPVRAVEAYAVALALGFVVNVLVFGPGHVVGTRAYWDFPEADSQSYLIGYRTFLHEPWHWAVFDTCTMNAPFTKSIAITDNVLFFAVLKYPSCDCAWFLRLDDHRSTAELHELSFLTARHRRVVSSLWTPRTHDLCAAEVREREAIAVDGDTLYVLFRRVTTGRALAALDTGRELAAFRSRPGTHAQAGCAPSTTSCCGRRPIACDPAWRPG